MRDTCVLGAISLNAVFVLYYFSVLKDRACL